MKTFSSKADFNKSAHQRLDRLEEALDDYLLKDKKAGSAYVFGDHIPISLVPFNLEEAIADPLRVRHKDGAKPSDISIRPSGEIWVRWMHDLPDARVSFYLPPDFNLLRLVAKPARKKRGRWYRNKRANAGNGCEFPVPELSWEFYEINKDQFEICSGIFETEITE